MAMLLMLICFNLNKYGKLEQNFHKGWVLQGGFRVLAADQEHSLSGEWRERTIGCPAQTWYVLFI